MEEAYKHSLGKRVQDTIAVVLFIFYACLLLPNVAGVFIRVFEQGAVWAGLLMTAVLAGYLLADFVSGFVHYLGDTYGSVTTPIFGKAFVYPFREHHVDPKAITRHSFVYVNGMNCLVSLPVLFVLHSFVAEFAGKNFFFAYGFVLMYTFILGIFATNQIHKYAHMASPPRWVRLLQRWRLVLSPAHHAKHHTAPFASYFCITTGWMNHLTESVGFFQRLTRWVKKT